MNETTRLGLEAMLRDLPGEKFVSARNHDSGITENDQLPQGALVCETQGEKEMETQNPTSVGRSGFLQGASQAFGESEDNDH